MCSGEDTSRIRTPARRKQGLCTAGHQRAEILPGHSVAICCNAFDITIAREPAARILERHSAERPALQILGARRVAMRSSGCCRIPCRRAVPDTPQRGTAFRGGWDAMDTSALETPSGAKARSVRRSSRGTRPPHHTIPRGKTRFSSLVSNRWETLLCARFGNDFCNTRARNTAWRSRQSNKELRPSFACATCHHAPY